MPSDLLLVGSIPYDTVEEVFCNFGQPLGANLHSLPDGEVGPRRHWISRVHYQVLTGHPDLEVIRYPKPENGVERQAPRGPGDTWQFRVRNGVDRVRFGDRGWRLGFARDAINSYFVFKTLKEKGVIAPHLRFQVSLPSVNSAMHPQAFPDHPDLAKIRPGYAEALGDELETMANKIPHSDLAIQWDCAMECQEAWGEMPGFDKDTAIERSVAQFSTLNPRIPEDVELGYHLCFGTLGGWPRLTPEDLTPIIGLANAFAASSGRRVDWIHVPLLPRTDDFYYEQLRSLELKGARLYLGLIHNMDTFEERLAAARKHSPEFGLAAYCGFGREPASGLPDVLKQHQQAIELTT